MGIFSEIWNWICDNLYNLLYNVVDLLPDSPFQLLSNSDIEPYLKYINYFIDFKFIVDLTALWLTACGVYYTYSIILRFLKTVD